MKKKLSCIMLVDDDQATNVYTKAIVGQAQVAEHIEVCQSGEMALAYLQSVAKNHLPQPALMFLDVNMPGMDGWDFLVEYNKLPDWKKAEVVIVMLTTSLNPDDETKAYQLGAKGFIRKPLTDQLVLGLVKAHFPTYI